MLLFVKLHLYTYHSDRRIHCSYRYPRRVFTMIGAVHFFLFISYFVLKQNNNDFVKLTLHNSTTTFSDSRDMIVTIIFVLQLYMQQNTYVVRSIKNK